MEWWQILIIVGAAAAAVILFMYFRGKKAMKKQEEASAKIEESKQWVSMLVIDKKLMKIKDSGLPDMVYDQMPKTMRLRNFPIVKAKVGPRIMSFITEKDIFEMLPVKKEVKAAVSGLYIVGVKGIRGNLEETTKQKKARRKKEKAEKSNLFNDLLKKGRGEM